MTECDEPGGYSCSRNVGSAIRLARVPFDGIPSRVGPRARNLAREPMHRGPLLPPGVNPTEN
jgi:hypothetical protein